MRFIAKTKKLVRNPKLFFDDFKSKRKKIILPGSSSILLTDIVSNMEKGKEKNKEKDKDKSKKKSKKQIPTYYQRVGINDKGNLFYERLIEFCKLVKIPFMTGATEDSWM